MSVLGRSHDVLGMHDFEFSNRNTRDAAMRRSP